MVCIVRSQGIFKLLGNGNSVREESCLAGASGSCCAVSCCTCAVKQACDDLRVSSASRKTCVDPLALHPDPELPVEIRAEPSDAGAVGKLNGDREEGSWVRDGGTGGRTGEEAVEEAFTVLHPQTLHRSFQTCASNFAGKALSSPIEQSGA